MKLTHLVLFLTFLTTAVLARYRRRLLLRRQSSYNKFMRSTALNYEKAKVETLGAIFKRHVQQLRHTPNKQVELVFLIDSSGSVGAHYFYEEVRFVKNLLADFTVDINSTRVSVITFSSPHKIFRYIDYLSEPSPDNHKCRLLQEDIPDVDYTAGGTHTLGAFLEAEKVLRSARADATKAIFLMTDGYSNGGDPRPIAHKLKAQGVRIFTFGIRDGFVWELQDMASEPKNETCYILDSFEEFEALAKRALHTDLQSGSYVTQSISKCGRLCNNGGVCCHQDAMCSCGTYTGKYKCLCKPGHYGSGLGKTGCKPCPPGTYKNFTGLGACTPCPDKHQMTPTGADSLGLCRCKKGYRNSGSQECTVFRCSKLSPPKHGFFVNNKCNNVFNAACGLKCKSGYELHGSSLRICQEDGKWSGQPSECIMKTCPSLPQPKNGHMICSTDDFSYSTVCRFTCNTGYQLFGSRKRTCLAIAFWTGIATRCRAITCPPLVEIKDGSVDPLSCLSSEVVFGTTCKVSCNSGYKLKGPHTKQCTPDGTWISSETGANLCLDESPPLLHCPRDIEVSADEKESLTAVEWTAPVPIDNSHLRPLLTSEPALSSGDKFPIGKTLVTYKAKDLSNNAAECHFTIHVIDKTPPRIDKCVSPPPTVSKAKATAVQFEEPQFSDNSGKPVEVAPSRRLKDLYPMGKTKIIFTGFDGTNNNNTCVVDVDVVPHLCMTPESPANGNITCMKEEDGVTCQISCDEGFGFADQTASEYSCQFEEGIWKPEEQYPFQDCSAVQVPNDVITPASITLTSDISCKDKQMLSEIVQNLEEEMKNKLNEACENELSCKMGDLSFVCENEKGFNKVPQLVNRKRRSAVNGHKTKLSLKFSLSGSVLKEGSYNEELETHLTDTLTRLLSSMKNSESQTLDVKGKSIAIDDMSYDIRDPEYQCRPGSIISNRTCVSCPAGTFCSFDQRECGKCPKGTYQDKENQTECIRCPDDQSTNMDNCKNIKDCKGLCRPGTFSPTGLEPCETCHQGLYQSDYASRECHPCGDGRTTPHRGSVSNDDCADLCPPGHASGTGLSPCYPCPSHSYQPKVGQMECLKCPGSGKTNKPGAIYLSQCVKPFNYQDVQSDDATGDSSLSFNRCDFDNPCKNGGICEDRGGYLFSCNCAPGFAGETCEEYVQPCKSSPCLNQASCLPAPNAQFLCECAAGFTGKFCEVDIDDCFVNWCENGGLCVDWIHSFSCNCQAGFTGRTCESLLENCDSNPCMNGGSCNMENNDLKCSCPQGFAGDLCEQDIDECLSLPCQNDATCVDNPGGYSCKCIPGYIGKNCEDDFDECTGNPCINGGQCEDSVGDYTCNCPDGFTGKRCEEALSSYYQLNFDDPSILDYAQLTIGNPLTAVTASFWMKTTDDDNQGTPFSYAAKDEPDAFTITDYKNLNIYINGEDVSAKLRLNDGNWQHVVFTWSSPRGEWKLYVNRLLLDQGYDLSTKRAIPAKGTFIIGQEQDEEGGGFSAGESFLGSLTHLNVWDRELSLGEIDNLRYACEGLEGNVIAWKNVQTTLRGGLTTSPSAFCDDCPKPVAPTSGSVSYTGVRPNDDVVYTCDDGYITTGRSAFKCLVSGEWEALAPSCEPVNCGHPGSPDNGYITGRSFSFGNRVRFQCNRGYELDGPESLYCDEYGEWDDDIPDCIEIECEIPLLSLNTIASVPSRQVKPGTVVTFSCTPGYKLQSEHDSSRCQIDGTFDKSVPTCDTERCPIPPTIDNGEPKEIKQDYGVGETVQYQCSYGYRFSLDVGNRRGSINCLPSGEWEDDIPECEEILCPDPPLVQNAEAVGDDLYVDAEVTYRCNAGYESVGRNAITCLETQVWTRLRMRCRPVECSDPPQIQFGSFVGDSYTFESKVEYQCDQGYVLGGNGELSCGDDRNWKGETPTCSPISCGQPSNIDNGRVKYADVSFGDIAEYVCGPGYVISGSSRVTCEANGIWTPGLPECRPRACPGPPDVLNAVYESPIELVFNSTVGYDCNIGHVMSGSPTLVCNEEGKWYPAPPVCEKITCPKPAAPDSGSVKVKGLSYSSIISYSCDQNFRLVGVDGRTCQVDGTWSDELPTCQPATCQPGDLDNGKVEYKDLSFGSIVTYSCDKGYRLEGDSARRCQSDLTLDGVAPLCSPVDCGIISPLSNGNITLSSSNTLFGTTATFVCNTGYYNDGVDNIYCGPDGKWSGSFTKCKTVTCPKVSKFIPNGHVIGSSFSYESILTYQCDQRYVLNGPGTRTCRADGNWDNPASSCVLVTCPPARIAYGILSTLNNTVGTDVSYSCQRNYRLEGPDRRTCLADGSWSGADPKCLRIRCNAPPQVDHAQSVAINETALEYTCDKGFDLEGSRFRVCESDDIWIPDAPTCAPSFCPDLLSKPFENGNVSFTSAKVGETAQYNCNPGYKLKGEQSRKCLKSGLWRGQEPKCEIIDCGHPGTVPNGKVVGSNYEYGALVRFECDEGYIQKGADGVRCEETGYWENLYSNCEKVYCPTLGRRIKHGRIYSDSTAYLSVADYTCKKGFMIQGVQQRTCLGTGEWSESEPSCIPVVCPPPEDVRHGILIGGKRESYGYGDQIDYECEIGYYVLGRSNRRCRKDATWTDKIPTCEHVNCPETSPIENGDYIAVSSTYKSVLKFYCFEGYWLSGDEEVVCQADGQWSGSGNTTCQQISCGTPPSIDNAYPNQTTPVFYNTNIEYTCNEGYIANGNNRSKCLLNSTLSYIDFSCVIVQCPSFNTSDVPHGIFETPSFSYKSTVEFTCEKGYRLSGENVIECESSGVWSSRIPDCIIVQCPSLETVVYGSITLDSHDFGSIATISCDLGYNLKGTSSLICLSSGLWNDSLPLCEIVQCPKPPEVTNGNILNSNNPYSVFDSKLEYACDFGYNLLGVNILRCTEFGTYDNPAPTCTRIQCPEIEDIAFGNYKWVNDTFISYKCNSGYNLDGIALRECVLGGVWGSPAPVCNPVPCPLPPSIDNGIVIGSNYTFGGLVEYRCNIGHNLIGFPISVCQEDGTWSDKNAQCMPVNCGEPEETFANGYIEGDIYTYLNEIEYVCSPGFELQGESKRTCKENGEWRRNAPICLRQSCNTPDLIANGAFFGDSFLYESFISYNCSQGYSLVGARTRQCESSLTWSGINPSCVRISCPPPGSVLNGVIDGSSYLYEDVIQISCNRGYLLEGSESRTCQADRSWSGVITVCTKIYCPVPPPDLLNGFRDHEIVNVYGVDDVLAYFCTEGHVMNGTGQRICESSGQWSTNFLQCYAMSCPVVTEIDNGGFTSNVPESPFTYPSSLSFTCDQGFRLVGSSTVECSSSGIWSGAISACRIIECENLEIENGFIQLLPDSNLNADFTREDGKLYAGDNVLIECNTGYDIRGISKTDCSLRGEWNLGFGSCERIECPAPDVINGFISGTSHRYSDAIQISCNRGYLLEGSESRTCQADKSWSGAITVCTKIYCPVPPPDLLNGFRDHEIVNVYGVDDVLAYFCTEGHVMNGTGQRICESSGQWSTNFLQCYAISCPVITEIDNGGFTSNVPESPFTYPSSLSFTCDQGFRLVGSSTVECSSSGRWSGAISACRIIECENLEIENGFIQLLPDSNLNADFTREDGKLYAGDNVLIECNTGYDIRGISKTDCSLRGEWNSGFGSCERIECPAPDVINGFISGTSHRYSDAIQISCNRGYLLEGSGTRTCQADRSWSGAITVCTKIYCPVPPPDLLNGFRDHEIVNVYGVDDVLAYFCTEGHVMNGTGQRICESSGQWSTNFLQCYAISCPDVSDIDNGAFNSDFPESPFTYPSSLFFTCNQRFRLIGSSTVECSSSGKWSEAIPTCSIIECEHLEVENGFIRLLSDSNLNEDFARGDGQFYAGDSVSIQCDIGYDVKGSSNTSCSFRGKWKSGFGTCQRVQCPLPSIANGIISGTSYRYSDEIQISCNRGYLLEGSESRTCQADRSWSGVIAVCTKIYCPVPPPDLLNGFRDHEIVNVYGVDDVLAYFCTEGHVMNGTGQRICESSGQWSTNFLQCYAISCPDVSDIDNGAFNSDFPESPFTYPSSLFFTCNQRFRLIGSSTVECSSSGKWSEAIPTCSIIECEHLEVENGFIQLLSNSKLNEDFARGDGQFYAGDSVSIQCDIGYDVKGSSNTSCSFRGKWKSGFGTCQRVQCPLPSIANGIISGTSYRYSDEIQISCNRGYLLEGSESRTCQADRSWSGAITVCTKIYCPVPPPDLLNGFRDHEIVNVYGVDDVLAYFCTEGHVMNGTGQRICESSGQWSTNFLQCYAISCPVVTSYENGIFNSDFPQSPFTYPSSLYFTCDTGFQLEGESSITCGSSGKWSEAIPQCSIIECGNLEIEYGQTQLHSNAGLDALFVREDGKYYAGDDVLIQCNSGYEISGEINAICSLEGDWSSESFCNPVTCMVPDIKGAQFSDVSETFNNKISVTCDDGLDLIGQDELTCGFDTNWVESLPRCELLACGSPSKVDNAVLRGESFNLGDVVNYECKAGYDLVGNNLLTCGPNNDWLGSYPVCVKVDCGQPVAIPDSYIDVSDTEFQSIATVYCLDGYELQGSGLVVCEADQQWKFDPSTQCSPLDCGNPPQIPNGSVFSEQTTFGSLAVYTCDTGHVIEGTSSMYCDSDGQWGYQVPICSPVNCLADVTQVAHASYTKTGTLYRDVVQYECVKGYTFVNPSATVLTCGDMGHWRGEISACAVIDCGLPPQFESALSSFTLTTYSNVASFYCITGYESNSNATKVFTCSDGGIWEGDRFECVKKNCLDYPDLINGAYGNANGTLYQDEIYYNCDKGYTKIGEDFIKCTSDGKWTNPYCAAVDCLEPPEISHGQYQLDSTTYDSEVQYQCDAGYVLTGKSTIECLDTGVWTPTQALCKPLNCRDPPTVNNAGVVVNTTLYQGVAAYSCEVGFISKTPMALSCSETGNWIGIVPKCEIVTCPLPEGLENGFVDFNGTNYASIATYVCNRGKKLVGQIRRTCLENGTWSHETPQCAALECAQPESIDNGKLTLSGLHFGGWAYYSCLEGYTLNGDNSMMCDENGFWNSSAPECKIIDCEIPPPLAYGDVRFDQTIFYSKATYTCTKGYSLVGNKDTICQADGKWSSDEKRECKLITCPIPPSLDNGLLISFNETFGSRAVYICLPDYKPQTLSILICEVGGLWYGNLIPCTKKLCPKPDSIDNGGFHYQGQLSVDTVVSYYCETGYDLVGPKEIVCTSEEVWSLRSPHCKPVTCLSLTEVPFSILFQEEEEAGFMSIATFQCQNGYKMVNQNDPDSIEAVYICNESGQWEGDGFECSPITCSSYPPSVDHAVYELTNRNLFGSKAIFKCETGYIMNGQNSVACDKDGKWSSLLHPVCEIASCEPPPDVPGAIFYKEDTYTYGSVTTYSCHKNYRLVGDSTIKCLANGQWTPAAFSCDSITCSSLTAPENGKILNAVDGIFVAGSAMIFACDDGFILIGPGSVSCLDSGLWDLPPPRCQKVIGVCDESITMDNALPPPPGRFPGDEILVECRDGYIGAGDMFAKCQDDGSWRIPFGKCRRISCGRPDSYDRRNVRVFGRSFLYGDTVRYMCRYGFSPVHNPPMLHCLSSGHWDNNASCIAQCKQKCDNGGRCLGLNRCKCMPGWAGFKCHLPICIFPCLNGGRCEGPYKCKCPHGYQGSRCERAICPRQCQNGGRCLRPGKCHCLPGFQGSACEDKLLGARENNVIHSLH